MSKSRFALLKIGLINLLYWDFNDYLDFEVLNYDSERDSDRVTFLLIGILYCFNDTIVCISSELWFIFFTSTVNVVFLGLSDFISQSEWRLISVTGSSILCNSKRGLSNDLLFYLTFTSDSFGDNWDICGLPTKLRHLFTVPMEFAWLEGLAILNFWQLSSNFFISGCYLNLFLPDRIMSGCFCNCFMLGGFLIVEKNCYFGFKLLIVLLKS